MTFLEENYEYISLTILILMFAFLLFLFKNSIYLSKFFTNKKFRVYSKYTFEPTNTSKKFTLNIFNNNVNDTRIIAFGFIYKNHNIDYYQTYLKEKNLPSDSKVIISSRDCILSVVDALKLKIIISDMNRGKRRVKKIQSYVSDSQGLTFVSNARMVRKQLSYMLKIDHNDSLEKKRQLRNRQKEEDKDVRRRKRIDKRLKRKEKFEKYWIQIKSKFPFIKK